MLRYVTLGSNDLERSARFYDAILAPLGYVRLMASENELGYGYPGHPAQLWIMTPYNRQLATFGNGTDVAFEAPSRESINAFYAAALAHGGTDEGAPGLRPHYTPTFYTAYIRDPDGNKLNAVFDAPV